MDFTKSERGLYGPRRRIFLIDSDHVALHDLFTQITRLSKALNKALRKVKAKHKTLGKDKIKSKALRKDKVDVCQGIYFNHVALI